MSDEIKTIPGPLWADFGETFTIRDADSKAIAQFRFLTSDGKRRDSDEVAKLCRVMADACNAKFYTDPQTPQPSSPELTADEREAITRLREDAQQALVGMCEAGPDMPHDIQCMYHEDCQRLQGDINTVDAFLTRTQSPPDTVRLPREVVELLVRQAKVEVVASYYTETPYLESEIQSASNWAIEAAQQALARAAKKEGE